MIKRVNCQEVLDHIYEYLNTHDLTTVTGDDIKEHLDKCRHCYSRYEFELTLVQRFKESGHECCPDKLKNKIKSLLKDF